MSNIYQNIQNLFKPQSNDGKSIKVLQPVKLDEVRDQGKI